MRLRFPHFLLALTVISLLSSCLAALSVLHTALAESAFTTAPLRPPADWDSGTLTHSTPVHALSMAAVAHTSIILLAFTAAVADFVSQVPVRKLLYIFLTQSASHVLLLMLLMLNAMLIVGWLLQGLLFSWNVSAAELKVARDQTLNFAVFRLIFLGSILETMSGDGEDEDVAPSSVAGSLPLAPGASALRELACWLCWFGLIGFLRWFLALLRERFSTAQASPYATVHTFTKYLIITLVFTSFNALLAFAVIFLCHAHSTWTVLSLLLFENGVLMASCIKIVFRYAMYLQTIRREQPWEERGSTLYYTVFKNKQKQINCNHCLDLRIACYLRIRREKPLGLRTGIGAALLLIEFCADESFLLCRL